MSERILPIVKKWLSDPNSNIGHDLVADMTHEQELYAAFFIVFIIWVLIKVARKISDDEKDKKQITILSAIARKLGVNDDEMLTESEKIRKQNEKRNPQL